MNRPLTLDHAEALQACAAGDRLALRRIYEAEAPRLVGLAQRITRRRDLAHDAVQDAFVQIWHKAGTFDPARGSGQAWIYTIVRNRALTLIRDLRPEQELDQQALEALPDPAEPAMALLERLEEHEALRRCLAELEEQRRRCILMAYVDGQSHTEIARSLGTPLGTIKAWIRRGLLALRDCLG